MKNEKIINAFNAVQPGDEIKNRVFDKVSEKQYRESPVKKTLISFAAAAAVICLVLLSSIFLIPHGDNIFAIKAYAMELRDDGTVGLREMDIADTEPEYWGGFVDGELRTMYVGIGLRCEGDDIENVEFSTKNGFFARQYIGNLSEMSMSGVSALYVGPDNQMVMFGNDFDKMGSTITLNKENAENYLLFWGMNYETSYESPELPALMNHPNFPDEIIVHAKATFTNGKTAEKDAKIDMSGIGSYSYAPSEEEKLQMQKDSEVRRQLLQSIPLDQCEVLPDSVQALTFGDTYEYHMGDPLAAAYIPITEEAMAAASFDENGIRRVGSSLPKDGSDGYIAVIESKGNGIFTGMEYKVPGQLILEYLNEN